MHAQFWIDSWQEEGTKTSFHRRDIHPYVLKHLPPTLLRGKRILIPLCGKTLDMAYFRQHAARVIGVELVEKAIWQFFDEQKIPFTKVGNRYEADRLTIICGDFLALTRADAGHIDLVYDRASLVALPGQMRTQYIARVNQLLPVGSQQFINTIEYVPSLNQAPFSISADEVADYYGQTHLIRHLEQPILPQHGMVRAYSLDYLKEHGFMLTKLRDM